MNHLLLRNKSLDALRGLSILAMVLSGSIAFGILPAWMYHAQTPPPTHVFQPEHPGISWVDLVFPFFLFSLGAAIPLALQKKASEGARWKQVGMIAVRRFAVLVFFALFTMHIRSIAMKELPPFLGDCLSVVAFVLLFFQLYRPAQAGKQWWLWQGSAYVLAVLLMYLLPFKGNKVFTVTRSDIIIIVLANMALFGIIAWWCTRRQPWWRIGILPFVMAIFLSKDNGSWNSAVFHWSPLPWAYQFYYLKYLFVVIPGTLAGDWLLQYPEQAFVERRQARHWFTAVVLLCCVMIVSNVVLLFARQTGVNLVVTVSGCVLLLLYARITDARKYYPLLYRFFQAGAWLLLLGLFFEAYEGGIKKDPSTWSYYLVTSGLAFFMLIVLYGVQRSRVGAVMIDYMGKNGKNPMVAYVAGNLLLLPLLRITGGMQVYLAMLQKPWTGVLDGLLFTGIVSVITVWFVRKGWLWKT